MEYKSDILWRMRLIYFAMAIFGLFILGRVVYIQLVEGDQWKERARTTTMRYVNIEAARGDICAEDGRLLATSLPEYEIRADLSKQVVSDEIFNANIDSLAMRLSMLFGDRTAAQYSNALNSARRNQERYHLVKRNVSHAQLRELKTFPIFRMGRFRGGLIVVDGIRREMPYRTLAARTIGYEREGIYVGLEGAYRGYLEGTEGKRLMQRISGNAWMPIGDQNEISPQNGMDVITTINVQIQDITEKALLSQLRRYNAQHGTAVVMEVKTGKIKAISNLSLNPSSGNYEESYNYAIGQSTEPGSTFKLASIMALLEDGAIDPEDTVDTRDGSMRFYDRTMTDANNEGHGIVTIKEAFALSSNVGISSLVYRTYNQRPERFVNHLLNMRLDQQLGLEISGEGAPLIRRVEDQQWSRVSLPWMSIGYEVSLTPLQILTFYNAVANGGRMMKPMFVSEIRQTGQTIERFAPQVLQRSIASPSTIETAKQMLEEVVVSGTAKSIFTEAYPIAGKTGTAQMTQSQRGYQTREGINYQASFAGYFPANDPVYSCIVVLYNPRGYAYTGSQLAAPAFREIADKIYAARMFVPEHETQTIKLAELPGFRSAHVADLKIIYNAFQAKLEGMTDAPFASTRLRSDTVALSERNFIENLVPEVVGMGLRDAIYVLENAGLKVVFTGRGIVRKQSIQPGVRIREGQLIRIELS